MAAEGEALCQSCGLCCNGALFEAVVLEPEEIEPARSLKLRVVTADDGRTGILQPCSAFTGSACGVYQHRPGRCRTFRCQLLADVEGGRVDATEAHRVVKEAKALAASLSEALGPVPGYPQASLRMQLFAHAKDGVPEPIVQIMFTYDSLRFRYFESVDE